MLDAPILVVDVFTHSLVWMPGVDCSERLDELTVDIFSLVLPSLF
jgi:hypothetical protein